MKRGAESSGASKKKRQRRIHSNVDLMALLRSPDPTTSSKLEQASEYVHACQTGSFELSAGALPTQHFILFLAEWIQQAIISAAKSEASSENAAVDHRSWEILAWCFSAASSSSLHPNPGILKGLELALRFDSTSEQALEAIARLLELLLHASSHGRTLRPQLMGWSSIVSSSLETLRLSDDRRLRISTLLAGGFSGFLSTFGNPKLGFQATVEKLLSPGMRILSEKSSSSELVKLQAALEALLETGLFHTIPVEGFPEVCYAAARWLGDPGGGASEQSSTHSSSHKLLFDKMKQAPRESLSSLGSLLRMFFRRLKIHRAALNTDVFGVRGNNLEAEDQAPEEEKMKKKIHLTENQQMFLVFVEMALPLLQELHQQEFSSSSSGEVIAAVNALFLAARDERVYVATLDTSSQGHLRFLRHHYNTLLDYSRFVSSSSTSSSEIKVRKFGEIITGITCVLEMEHRAADDRVQDFWVMLLAAAATSQACEQGMNKVILAGCRMLEILSELRNFSSLSELFSSLKLSHLQPELLVLSPQEHEVALRCFVCHPSFLGALGKMVGVLPEAQAPEIISMVARDAQETLELTGKTPAIAQEAGVELYASLLENLNITPTNAFQTGNRTRELVTSVISAPLSKQFLKKKKKKKRASTSLRVYSLLRLYMISRSLHRQCLTLMPPQKAMKAGAAAREVNWDSPELDWNSIEAQELSFFSWIDEEPGSSSRSITISKLVSEARGAASSPCLLHLLDRLIIQRLGDLRRYICSLEFFQARFASRCDEDPVLEAPDASREDSSAAGELLLSLRSEASELVALLFEGAEEIHSRKNCSWNEVFAGLNEENIHIARWLLVSRTTELWSEFSTRSEMKRFFSIVFCSPESLDEGSGLSVSSLNQELLSNLLLYENEVLQKTVLRSAWDSLRSFLPVGIKYKALRQLSESNEWDSKIPGGDASLLTPEALEKCIKLVKVLSSLSSSRDKTHIFSIFYVERFLMNLLSSEPGSYELELLELFAVCRKALRSSFIRSEDVCRLLDVSLFQWLQHSINLISELGRSSEFELLFASVMKSTQDIMQVKARLLFAQESRRLLGEAPLTHSEEDTGSFLEFFKEQSRVLIDADASRDSTSGAGDTRKLLASVATTRVFLSSVAGCIEALNKECQENKEKNLKWSPELPAAWSSCLLQAEKGVVAMLLNRVSEALELLSEQSILDVFTGFSELESGERELENEKHSEDEQDDSGDEEVEDPMDVEDDEEAEQSSAVNTLFNTGLAREELEIIGELFMAMSSLIKLRSLYFSPFASSRRASGKPETPPKLISLLGLLQALLSEATGFINKMPGSLFWIHGAVKCMDSIGFLLPSLAKTLSPAEFRRWVIIHIDLLAAILSFQASSPSAEVSRDNELLLELKVDVPSFYTSLRAAVKDSFGSLVKFSLREHLMVALQTIHRGFSGGSSGLFKLASPMSFGDGNDGRVGVVPAAAVECLAVTLDSISGRWRLKAVAKYSPKLVAGLFNLITRLQGPALFVEEAAAGETPGGKRASSAPVVARVLEIITRVASREVIFRLKPGHVALALHTPAGIMKPIYELRSARELKRSASPSPSSAGVQSLFIASCKALCSVLRHHKRESGRCIALLAESLRVLLHCLESSSNRASSNSYFSMELSSAVQCSQWLRRVYEELGEHKESLSRYITNVLSDYLCVLSGNGPLGGGLEREIDRELRPGVYALLCSSLDLQQLHSALGEGAMRNNLVMIRQEYEKNYRYTGKV